jgi:CubicO group peptidase (beta-lactamase class C family)
MKLSPQFTNRGVLMKLDLPLFTCLRRLLISIVVSGLIFAVMSCVLPQFNSLAAVQAAPKPQDFTSFEAHLESIRQALKIPGMSAAIVQDQELVWAKGFGYADLDNQVAATPDTPYGLASVTKPVAATLIMGLVEKGLIDLDAPVSQYGVHLENPAITVRHLLTHTSEGVLGTVHDYNGNRYAALGGVIEGATGQTFAALLSETMLLPLGMQNTALNPISSWGGPTNHGLADFRVALGWEKHFKHYPDVYERLAQPYQLDSDYNIIPGMYPIYHNPAAGLISSVTDLARWDIALDQGLLLGDSAKAEMFSPAVSTYKNRSDLMYGLGWYVQDFEGTSFLWHTGRWSPSTSALYLKVPEKNLTFIVLGNTDNLTVPFGGLGDGDVAQSILALSFLRYFIIPEKLGVTLPDIDWNAAQADLIRQLQDVRDETARKFLERELWSFRKVYASVGQVDQAEKLRRVNITAYRRSNFRNDPMFTQTPAPNQVVSPVIRARTFVWVSRGMAVWFVLVLLSVIWMAVRMVRLEKPSRWGKFLWWLSALFLGPVSVVVSHLTQGKPDESKSTHWRQIWISSVLVITVYSAAWAAAIALLMESGDNPHPLIILGLTYLIPLFMVLFFLRIPLLSHRMASPTGWLIARVFWVEVTTWNLGYALYFPLTMLLNERFLTIVPHPTNPFFWGMVSIIALIGVIVLVPLHLWMSRREVTLPSGLRTGEATDGVIPGLRITWPALITTFVLMLAALAITISQLG